MSTSDTSPSLREYVLMAVDAYDNRLATNSPLAPEPASPSVPEAFTGWAQQPTARASALRNADTSFGNGMEANIYANEAEGQLGVAFRGTEFDATFNALERTNFGLIDEANLDKDLLTLLGYYQDDGNTLAGFVDTNGGLERYLRDVVGFGERRADIVSDVADFIAGIGGGLDALAEEGEQELRNQVQSAVLTVVEAAAANPGLHVSVVGHSLGGALAASVSAALGLRAVLLDPAPYASQVLPVFARTVAVDLLGEGGPFQDLDTDALGWDLATPPRTHLANLTETHRLEGSFVPDIYLTASPLDLPEGESTDRVIDLEAVRTNAFSLHSPELIGLAVDSDERASEDRPSLAALSATLPSLIEQSDNAELVAPSTERVDVFYRGLLVSDPFYRLLADVVEWIDAAVERYAPEEIDEPRATELERDLINLTLRRLGIVSDTGEIEEPSALAGIVGNMAGGGAADIIVGAPGEHDVVVPGLGDDFVATGDGPDSIIGSLSQHDGDAIFDLSGDDRLIFTGASFGAESVGFRDGGRTLVVNADLDDTIDAAITLSQPALQGSLSVVSDGSSTTLRLDTAPPGLETDEVQRVALLYEASFGRRADVDGLNFWVEQREAGRSEVQVAASFVASPEFEALAGAGAELTSEEIAVQLYANVLGRSPDQLGLDYWVDRIENPDFGPERAVLAFSLSAENVLGSPEIERIVEFDDGSWDFG